MVFYLVDTRVQEKSLWDHLSGFLLTGSTRNECNHFEAMYRAEFSIHFLSSYRKLKPKDEQIDW